ALLAPATWVHVTRLQRLAGVLLIALPAAALVEHLGGVDLGIDLAPFPQAIHDGNPWPGRMAPNTCLGFLAAGLVLILLNCARPGRVIQRSVAALNGLLMLIGVSAMLGFILHIEAIYQLASFNSMSAPTAAGLAALGAGLAQLSRERIAPPPRPPGAEVARITGVAVLVLTVLAIVAGFTGFAVLREKFEVSSSATIESGARTSATLVGDELGAALALARQAAARAPLLAALDRLSRNADDAARSAVGRELDQNVMPQGFAGIRFVDPRGATLAMTGEMVGERASVALSLADTGRPSRPSQSGDPTQPSQFIQSTQSGETTESSQSTQPSRSVQPRPPKPAFQPSQATLLWQDGFVLRTRSRILHEGRLIGELLTEQRLGRVDDLLGASQKLGRSNDMVLCGSQAAQIVCFPSRLYGANLRAALAIRPGQPIPPMARALAGESGSAQTRDLRGVMVLAGFAPLPEHGLGLVQKVDIAEAFSPLRERLNYLIGLLVLFVAIGTLVLRTELRPLIANQAREKERLRVTLHSIGDAVITTDMAGQVTYMNPVAEQMTGWPGAEAHEQALAHVFQGIHEHTGEPAANPVDAVLTLGAPSAPASALLIQRGGARFTIEHSAAPLRDADGVVIGVVLVFRDISHARRMADEMAHQASHDLLTGLINRRAFEARLEAVLAGGGQPERRHTLLYIDLDQFKVVNDLCGHIAGDELLRQLAGQLEGRLRRSDTLARLGGDEFGVLLENCSNDAALRIAELLRKTAGDFQFVWAGQAFSVSLSIGLVGFGGGEETLTGILRMADAACYVAKDQGRNRIHACTPQDQALARRDGEMGWIGQIQKALEEGRFVLYSQKIQDLGAGVGVEPVEHYEMLLRMLDEHGKLVPPMAFIPAAERYGLMPALDRWVIREALSQYGRRHPAGSRQGVCAINLSGTSICDEHLAGFVRKQFAHFKVAPSAVCFEVTETAAIGNLSQAVSLIRELKAMGCTIALDDFGSGMSSFAYLKHLPVDYLKIDGAFVKDMLRDPIDRAMVASINQIGHVMGLKTIAEFVENDEVLDALREMGVDFAQGYGVEKPRPFGVALEPAVTAPTREGHRLPQM
ncbi:MAG: EAL domain-containing protein, partial [Massilia sp.]